MIIRKWENSLAAHLPQAVADSIGLHKTRAVEIEAVNGRIVITPVTKKKEYKLEELLKQCESEAMVLGEDDREWLDAEPVGEERVR